MLDAAIAAPPTLVSVSFGSPAAQVGPAGIVVAAEPKTCTALSWPPKQGSMWWSPRAPKRGHTGEVGTLPLPQHLLEDLEVPVVAAGGISTPEPAVLAAGAGASVGTCLLACPEATSRSETWATVLAATETDAVRTQIFDVAQGIPWPELRRGALRKRFTEAWADWEAELAGNAGAAAQLSATKERGDYDIAHIYAGQTVGLAEMPALPQR